MRRSFLRKNKEEEQEGQGETQRQNQGLKSLKDMQRSVWLKKNGSCLWVIGSLELSVQGLKGVFVFIRFYLFLFFFWSSPMSLYVGCSPFVFPAVVSNATCVSAGLTASKSIFGYHPSWIWAQSSLIHRIGWWENWNRKPLYLMVKTMVSA